MIILIMWDIFGTIRPLKIIFWDYIFENFRLKMNKNTFFGLLWLYKGNYYLFKLRNEDFLTVRVYDTYNLIAFQDLYTDDIEGREMSKKFRAETSGYIEKLMACVGH